MQRSSPLHTGSQVVFAAQGMTDAHGPWGSGLGVQPSERSSLQHGATELMAQPSHKENSL